MNPESKKINRKNIPFTTTPGLKPTHPCYNCRIIRDCGGVYLCYRPRCPFRTDAIYQRVDIEAL